VVGLKVDILTEPPYLLLEMYLLYSKYFAARVTRDKLVWTSALGFLLEYIHHHTNTNSELFSQYATIIVISEQAFLLHCLV
jgi:hypothetical protein